MTNPMLFKEIAQMLNVTEYTLRQLLKTSKNEDFRNFASKKGTGSYYYTGIEVDFIIKNVCSSL